MSVSNSEKLRECISLIGESAPDDPAWSAAKLRWLLFYCDFTAFAKLASSITGAEYVRSPSGPSPRGFESALQSSLTGGELRNDFRVLRPSKPKRELFSTEELSLIAEAILRFRDWTPEEILDRGLPFVGWDLAEIGEGIPYEIALVGKREPTRDEVEYSRSLHSIAAESLAGDG